LIFYASGARSLHFETRRDQRLARLYWRWGEELKRFPLKPSTLYRISFWAKTTRYIGGYSPYCGVHIYDKDGKQVAKPDACFPRYERDWELCRRVFLSPPTATEAVFHISVLGEGNCSYVDNVELREIVLKGRE